MKSNKILAIIMAFSIFQATAFAATSIPIYIEGQVVDASSTPAYVSTSNRTMIPVRKVGELLGLRVDWQSPNVILSGKSLKTNKEITVKLNAKTNVATLNGAVMKDVIESKSGSSYITLRVLAEAFGYQVDWKNKCVYIEKPQNAGQNNNTSTKPDNNTSAKPDNNVTVKPDDNTSTKPDNNVTIKPDNNTSTKPNDGSDNLGSGSQNNTTQKPSGDVSNASYNEQVLALVNVERAKQGLSALKLDEELCKVALIKSNDMRQNKYFSHTSPTYGSPFDMMKQFGISYSAAAENIAQGYATPQAVVTGWMNSAGHRANILNGTYTHMGVGYDGNGNYWTQMFIKR